MVIMLVSQTTTAGVPQSILDGTAGHRINIFDPATMTMETGITSYISHGAGELFDTWHIYLPFYLEFFIDGVEIITQRFSYITEINGEINLVHVFYVIFDAGYFLPGSYLISIVYHISGFPPFGFSDTLTVITLE